VAKEILVGYGVDLDAVSGWLEAPSSAGSIVDVSRGMFAGEVGTPRLVQLFAKFGIRATWFVPGHSLETFPKEVDQVLSAGHEVGLHGYSHESLLDLDAEQEDAVLAHCVELVEQRSGKRPRGYITPSWEMSPATLGLLLKYGLQ
jgi:peptidoglycan/xylan/chitin deacetylase (PgdA/CDA1 family)